MPKIYRPNGAVYAAKIDILINWNDIMPLNLPFKNITTHVVIIDNISALDIDQDLDFVMAEVILKSKIEEEINNK